MAERNYKMKPRKDQKGAAPAAEPTTPEKPTPVETERIPQERVMGSSGPGSYGLIRPVEATQDLVDAFKAYQELKEKLLEDTDYTWFVRYSTPTSDKDQLEGFRDRKMAEKFLSGSLKGSGELEKKVKKSGCLKLQKAFGISTKIIGAEVDPGAKRAWYRVEAEAPNGQTTQRTGYSDSTERGKKNTPFDSIDATALTRATDRAIMALLGGENTAEEFETPTPAAETNPPPAETKPPPADTPRPPPETPRVDPVKMPLLDRIMELADGLGLAQDDVSKAICERFNLTFAPDASLEQLQETIDHLQQKYTETPVDLQEPAPGEKTKEELQADLDRKFNETEPADPRNDRTALTRAIFSMGKDAGFESEALKENIKQHFNVKSFKDLTIEQLQQAIARLEEKLSDPLSRPEKS